MERFGVRRDNLLKALRTSGADALLVTSFTNVSYLTGFTGDDSYLLLSPREAIVISDPRYTIQLEQECPDLRLHIRSPGTKILEAVVRVVRGARPSRLAIEGDSLSVSAHEHLSSQLPKLQLVTTSGLVEQLREVKDKLEIAEIRQAADFAQRAFDVLRATLRPDQTEKEVADNLEHQVRLFGAKGCSFPPIVAAGLRSALPHARPTDERIGGERLLLVDWGATARLYKSDLTRVLVTARISPKLERVYGLVLTAQERAIAAIRPGVTGREVDAIARATISDGGFGKHFGHGLGHGIGLDIHEGPRLNKTNDQPLKAGMVATVEPGIYLPGWGGVRIEDDVLVTKTGCEVLTSCSKKLEEAIVC